MKPSTGEWVDKAEEDYRVMAAIGGLNPPAHDAAHLAYRVRNYVAFADPTYEVTQKARS